tara:strand:+ start:1639 stop:1950 length:312 start_codon:yes stop_codon:yes gene_type:complete
MPWFVKTENFTKETLQLLPEKRQVFIAQHKKWVASLKRKGRNISSGYLIDENKLPGGGGLLMIEAKNFAAAKKLILKDPMIVYGLVAWEIHEWIPIIDDWVNN